MKKMSKQRSWSWLACAVLGLALLFAWPAAASADNETPLSDPTGLHWDQKYPYKAVWEDEDQADVDYYEVKAVCSKDGNVAESAVKKISVSDSPVTGKSSECDFSVFLETQGDGFYSFKVKAFPKENSGRTASQEIQSQETQYYVIETEQTLDPASEDEDDDGGYIRLGTYDQDDGFVPSSYDPNKPAVYPEGSDLAIMVDPDTGFVVKAIYVNDVEEELKPESDGTVFCNIELNQNVKAKVVFSRGGETQQLIFDLTAGHAELTGDLVDEIKEELGFDCQVDSENPGKILIRWPKTSTIGDAIDELKTLVEDYIDVKYPDLQQFHYTEWIHNGEEFNDTFGLKPLQGYANLEEMDAEEDGEYAKPIPGNCTIYMHWNKAAESGSFTVESPYGGTVVSLKQMDIPWQEGQMTHYEQTPSPEITAAEDSQLVPDQFNRYLSTVWKDPAKTGEAKPFEGIITAGQKYTAQIVAGPGFGFFINKDKLPTVKVNGELAQVEWNELAPYGCIVSGEAEAIKSANTMTVKAKTATVKGKKGKKLNKNKTIAIKKAMTVNRAAGTVTYKKANKIGGSKIKINAKTGKITLKKGLKKKTYKVKIKVMAAGSTNYLPAAKTVTVTIKVK